MPREECLSRADAHLKLAIQVSLTKPTVNVALARALFERCSSLMIEYDSIPAYAQPWAKAAVLYFAQTEDGEHDFDSFLGFEDDCEILNAVLTMAGREDLTIAVEDYD